MAARDALRVTVADRLAACTCDVSGLAAQVAAAIVECGSMGA